MLGSGWKRSLDPASMSDRLPRVKSGFGSLRPIGILVAGLLVSLAAPPPVHGAAEGPHHVYLTWQGNTSTTMTVVFHVNGETAAPTWVRYDRHSRGGEAQAYRQATVCVVNALPGADDINPSEDGINPAALRIKGWQAFEAAFALAKDRRVHHAQLTDLEPGATYHFVVGSEALGYSAEKKFRTLPLTGAPRRVVNGADMTGDRPGMEELMDHAAAFDPDFALLGGDLAYDDGNFHKIMSWERALSSWAERMVTPGGYLIPMVAAIGNHETNTRNRGDMPRSSPFYLSFVPQGGSTFFTRAFGDGLVLYVLNSGHLVRADEQVPWLREQMRRHQNDFRWSMAMYHVPLYPIHRSYSDGRSGPLRRTWLPVFDEFKLDVGLEHHDHAHKRTHRLRGEKIDPQGTLYVGDGAFGKSARPLTNKDEWFIAAAAAEKHVWLIEFAPAGLHFRAVNPDGQVFDEYLLEKAR